MRGSKRLRKKAEPLAKANGVPLRLVNTQTDAAATRSSATSP